MGFEPMTSLSQDMCSTAVLQPLPQYLLSGIACKMTTNVPLGNGDGGFKRVKTVTRHSQGHGFEPMFLQLTASFISKYDQEFS